MLTRSGLGAVLTAVVLAICGTAWGYEELIVVAVATGAAVAIALWTARLRPRTRIVRSIAAPRVARGDPIHVVYRATNLGRTRAPAVTIVDRCDGVEVSTAMPAISAGDHRQTTADIATRRRGEFAVGPALVERLDPLGFVLGRRAADVPSTVLVHPRLHTLRGPYGAMSTVEHEAIARTVSSDPLSGFVSLREYVDGDDPRLIHWPTSARLGTVMLREHVDLRRPEFVVVLDAAQTVADPASFEEMVDVAASVAVHGVRNGVRVTLRTTARAHPGWPRPVVHETQVLDLLTPVQQAAGDGLLTVAELFRATPGQATVVVVTGPSGPSGGLLPGEGVSVVRVGHGSSPGAGVALAVETAAEFAARWRPWG